MTAKKTAPRKSSEAKPAKAKTSERKSVKPQVTKSQALKSAAAKPPAKAAAAKTEAKLTVKAVKQAPVTAKPAEKAPAAKKPGAAAARSKPAPMTSFDPDRRRELIAAAAARRRKTAPAKVAAPAPIVITQQPREPSPAERHRFSVGDQVRVISTSGMWFKHGIDYRVTAALPPQAGKLQYRIKNEQEPFERVVSESQLAIAQAQAPHAQF